MIQLITKKISPIYLKIRFLLMAIWLSKTRNFFITHFKRSPIWKSLVDYQLSLPFSTCLYTISWELRRFSTFVINYFTRWFQFHTSADTETIKSLRNDAMMRKKLHELIFQSPIISQDLKKNVLKLTLKYHGSAIELETSKRWNAGNDKLHRFIPRVTSFITDTRSFESY